MNGEWLETDDFDMYQDNAEDYDDDSEEYYGEDYDEDYDDSEWIPGLNPFSDIGRAQKYIKQRKRAKANKRRKLAAQNRARQHALATRRRTPSRSSIQRTRTAIEKVDLDNKVQADMFGRALRAQQKRISGNETTLALSKIEDELKTRLPELIPSLKENASLKTAVLDLALPIASLAFLKPEKRGTGFSSVVSDPRFWGPGLTAAIAIFAEMHKKAEDDKKEADKKKEPVLHVAFLDGPPRSVSMAGVKSTLLVAEVRDENGRAINPQPEIEWSTSDSAFATVSNGTVTGKKIGPVLIKAKVKDTNVEGRVVIQVNA